MENQSPLQRAISVEVERARLIGIGVDPDKPARDRAKIERRQREGIARGLAKQALRLQLEAAPSEKISEGSPVSEHLGDEAQTYCNEFFEIMDALDFPGASIHSGLVGIHSFGEDPYEFHKLKKVKLSKSKRHRLRQLGVRQFDLSRIGYPIGITRQDIGGTAVYLCADGMLRDVSGKALSSKVSVRTGHPFTKHHTSTSEGRGYWGDTLGTSTQYFPGPVRTINYTTEHFLDKSTASMLAELVIKNRPPLSEA